MVAIIRKMKMASKKNTFKPFNNVPKPNPAMQPVNFGPLPGFGLPGAFMVPGMVPVGQVPFQGHPKGPRPAPQGPRTVPVKSGSFNSVDDLLKAKAQFLGLEESARAPILRKLLLAKLQGYGTVVDL